ncbi:MAG: hypothetical protein AAB459_02690 [Patescibacteria group bacterium]
MPRNHKPMYERDPRLSCWNDCPEEQRERCQQVFDELQINGDPQQAGVALLEDTRNECETGPVRFMGEIVCGRDLDRRDVG